MNPSMPTIELAPQHRISRVIKGGWQLAGGHGAIDVQTSLADMMAFCDAGITTFDCADIYTGVEALIGKFCKSYGNQRGEQALAAVKVHTKCVPDLEGLANLTRADLERGIHTSLTRLGREQLDLVQFHWWDYNVERYLEVASWLSELRQQGKIAHIGGTNFDTRRLNALIDEGIPLVSMQVQYSLLDDRPSRLMVEVARERGVHLICYGTVSGGLLSEKWLDVPEPRTPFENRSLTKYKLIVDEFGGWELFQELLQSLSVVAARHDTDIATVASRLILDRPGVAAVIVGARNRSHLNRNVELGSLILDEEDRLSVEAVVARACTVPGDVFDVERDRNGVHGSIMKYNLNEGAA